MDVRYKMSVEVSWEEDDESAAHDKLMAFLAGCGVAKGGGVATISSDDFVRLERHFEADKDIDFLGKARKE